MLWRGRHGPCYGAGVMDPVIPEVENQGTRVVEPPPPPRADVFFGSLMADRLRYADFFIFVVCHISKRTLFPPLILQLMAQPGVVLGPWTLDLGPCS